MSTLSIPINGVQEEFIKSYIEKGNAANKADVVRKALRLLAEQEAIDVVLKAQREPTLHGDIRELMKKIV